MFTGSLRFSGEDMQTKLERQKELNEFLLRMGLDYFFEALADVADDSIKMINEKYPDAHYSLFVWLQIKQTAENMYKTVINKPAQAGGKDSLSKKIYRKGQTVILWCHDSKGQAQENSRAKVLAVRKASVYISGEGYGLWVDTDKGKDWPLSITPEEL